MISLIKVSDSGPLGSLIGFKGVARLEASGSDKQPLHNHAILSKSSQDQVLYKSWKAKAIKNIIQEVNRRRYFLIHFLLENSTKSCRFQLNRMSNNLYSDQSLW